MSGFLLPVKYVYDVDARGPIIRCACGKEHRCDAAACDAARLEHNARAAEVTALRLRRPDDIRAERFGSDEAARRIDRGLLFSLAANGYTITQISRLTLFDEPEVIDILDDIDRDIARAWVRFPSEVEHAALTKERARLAARLREIDVKLGALPRP